MNLVKTAIMTSLLASIGIAATEPVLMNNVYPVGPYRVSFDLIGIRDLSNSTTMPVTFDAEYHRGILFNLLVKDRNTEEYLQLQILKNNQPVAGQAAQNRINPDESEGLAKNKYGDWHVRWSMISGFNTVQAIDDYTLCSVTSTASWDVTKKVLETISIELSEK